MSVHHPLSRIPLRAARWSATHPWRAIAAWLGLVVIAVGLAMAVPTAETTDADYRLGESGHADAMMDAAGLDAPDCGERPDHAPRRRHARRRPRPRRRRETCAPR